jgi:hypothetical protein
MKIFGKIVDGPELRDDYVQTGIILDRELPPLLPIEGSRVRVTHSELPRICYNCFNQGHLQRDCRQQRVAWFDYLRWLQKFYNIPDNYFREFREDLTISRMEAGFSPSFYRAFFP